MSVAIHILRHMVEQGFQSPHIREAVITPDGWSQIMAHMADSPERRQRRREAAVRNQESVERYFSEVVPTRRLEFVKTLEPPISDAEPVMYTNSYDGSLVTRWLRDDGSAVDTIDTPKARTATVFEDILPCPVNYFVPLPGERWLGTRARDQWDYKHKLLDTAWVVDEQGNVLASSNLGDASLCPVVGKDGQIWVTYFDEAPQRGKGPTYRRAENDEWVLIPGSAIPLESVGEYSDRGKHTAGYTGMTVFDEDLKVVDRHSSGTYICEVYWTHTDGERFWYLSYPTWAIDVWGPDGQEAPIPASVFKKGPFVACSEGVARFSAPGEHRDSLYTPQLDGTIREEMVVFPDGTPLRQGIVSSWGRYLHYFDGLDWYRLLVFPKEQEVKEQ